MADEEEKEMATTAEDIQVKLAKLRKKARQMNKDIPVIKAGKKGAIELDPNNPSHREWYEGR